MPTRVCVRAEWSAAMAVRLVPLPGFRDRWNGSSQLQDAADDVVLGRLSDDDRQAWSVSLALATPARDRPLRDRVDDSAQAASSDGERAAGPSLRQGRT